ncbi:hypothetical protein ABZP36_003777 [Zizania latifolia]
MNTSGSYYNRTPCSYAVLIDTSNFNFSTTYLTSPMEFNNAYGGGQVPVVLDWAIRTANNCDKAWKDPMSYMCKSDNSRRLTILLWLTVAFAAELLAGGAKAECQHTKCGGVDISYPFGISSENCAFSDGFKIDCNDNKPFYGDVEVLNISLPLGQIRVLNSISSSCYNTTSKGMDSTTWDLNLTGTPCMFSDSNKLTVIGCRTLAYISDDYYVGNYMSGCVSACRRGEIKSATNGTCSGIGCCQTPIPKGLNYYQVWFDVDTMNTSGIYNRTPCSYAVLMDTSNFNFSTTYLTSPMEFNISYGGQAPMVLDWAIRTPNSCDEARKDSMSYMCKSKNSRCLNSSNGPGYICNCREGYQGNPYLQGPNGCQGELHYNLIS